MWSNYRDMKNKYKIQADDRMYFNYIQDAVSQMFSWDEKIYCPQIFDRIIRDCGMGALIKTDTSDYTPVFFYPTGGDRYADGWFKDCKCFDFRGKEYDFSDWLTNPEILVFFNTQLRNPDIFCEKYSEMLTDVDFSIKNNVHYSRMHPVPVARDKKTKNRVDRCMKDVSNGEFNTVLMETTIQDLMEDGDGIYLLNITDVEKSQYIQYLSHLHDSIISRLFFYIGLGTTDNGKQAQITEDELNKNDDASITMAYSWYNARKEAIEVAKKKGHELTFDFSPIWKKRIDSILQPKVESTLNNEEGEKENAGDVEADSNDNPNE